MMQQAFKRSLVFQRANTCRFAVRPFSTWKEKERAEEKSYFSKQDAKLLKALVEKMDKNNEKGTEAAQEHAAVSDDLSAIFERHELDKNGEHSLLWQELQEWRRSKYWTALCQHRDMNSWR